MAALLARRHHRQRELCRQLPEAFEMISRAIKAGQTVPAALQIIADHFEKPIATEFALCYEQQNLGMSRESALRRLAARSGVMELQIFVVALLVQARSGGDLIELLDNLALMIRKRLKLGDRVRALTGEGRMQAMVLIVLPIAAFLGIVSMAPDYASCLLERPWLLCATAIAQVAGSNVTSLAPYLPFVAFAVVSAIIYALFAYFDPYWVSVRGRLDQFDNAKDSPKRRLAGGSNKTAPTSGWFTLPTVSLFRGGDRSHLTQRLAYAGVYQPQAVARYFSISLLTLSAPMLICLTLTLAGLLRWDYAMLFACIGGLTGALAPRLWLDRAIKKRHLQFRRSLPDFLDLMTVCLEGGLSLQETIRRVSDELQLAHSALAAELAVVQRDVELGATVDQALKRFAARSGYEGVRSLSTFIR
ncbi:unnamed protein product, partial [Symbiodinium sp. CCMP2456]